MAPPDATGHGKGGAAAAVVNSMRERGSGGSGNVRDKDVGKGRKLPGRAALPSQRKHVWAVNPLPATPELWLRERQQRDHEEAGVPPHLWMIHNKLYDLEPFMDRHPGGREWLEFVRGMDCTMEFETHHLDDAKVQRLLAKYYVRDADPARAKRVQAYTFEEDGFYKTFKRRAHAVLKEHGGVGGGRTMEVASAVAIALWTLSYAATCITGSPWLAALAGALLLSMFGVGHNYFHQRNHPFRYAMDLTFAGHHQWRISHAISHHGFPNLEIDIELSQLEPISSFIRSRPGYGPWIYLCVVPYYLVAASMDIVRTWVGLFTGETPRRPEQILRIAQLGLLVACQGLGHGLLLFYIMHTMGALGLFAASFPVHRTEYHWSDGCQPVEQDKADFAEHVLAVASDYGLDLGLFSQIFLAGSFNNHIIHHLLPTLDLSKQQLLLPLLDDMCKEFKVQRRKRSFWDLFSSYVRALHRCTEEGLKYFPYGRDKSHPKRA